MTDEATVERVAKRLFMPSNGKRRARKTSRNTWPYEQPRSQAQYLRKKIFARRLPPIRRVSRHLFQGWLRRWPQIYVPFGQGY